MGSSIVELLKVRSAQNPHGAAYTFLTEGESTQLTFAQLDARARAIGTALQSAKREGGRALLLFPPGLEFITAFLGCLYTGTVAVPAYPPRKNRGLNRLTAIARDAEPELILTTSALAPAIETWAAQTPAHKNIRVLAADLVPDSEAESWRDFTVKPDALAFLQYTSGSTGSPRGVMVTHANIVANEEMIRHAFDQSESSVIVSWLPLYHDMGLIGGVLQPLYVGASCVLMSPLSFLRRPRRWLEVISAYQATTSGGPNFAYDLCVRKISPAEAEGLDLSSWKVAFNGAEPVRGETIERFTERFGRCGFQKSAFYPCYGLAEATLFVTGGDVAAEPQVASVSAAALQENRIVEPLEDDGRTLVGCGRPRMDHEVLIVDPETQAPCLPSCVGEIWLTGPSVARGYWNRPDESRRDFEARLFNNEGPYLRTGDLGFFRDGQLFITGRLKDLIIVRGRNFYPHDIEYTVERCHPSLRPGCGAAVSLTVENEERVVVVQEVDRGLAESDAEVVIETIRGAVAQEHELFLHDVVLIRAGSIPKTSSGKIQRHACREAYVAQTLDVVARSVSDTDAEEFTGEAIPDLADFDVFYSNKRRKLIEDFLKSESARILRISRARLNAHESLVSMGLDSLGAVDLKHAVEQHLGVSISLPALLDDASITQVADEILEERNAKPHEKLSPAGPVHESPLTYGQRGLWFVQRLAPESGAYHIPVVIQIDGELDAESLRRAFQAIVDRHPALRTTFEQRPDGQPVQHIHDSLAVDFTTASAEDWDEQTLTQHVENEAYRAFDLVHGPTLRVTLFRRSSRQHVLVFTVHHLVGDLRSLLVIFRELRSLYLDESAELNPLPARYSDYVAWEQTLLNGPEGTRLWNYWKTVLFAPLPTLDLPSDRPRPAVQTYRGGSRALNLDTTLTDQLRALASSSGASLFVVLLTAFKVLLHRYTGQTDIVVGSPVSGRNLPEFDDLVGYFVNPLVLRTDTSGASTFRELTERVKRTVLGALEHQEYPFALLAERLNLARDPSRSPLFQVMFAFQQSQPSARESISSLVLGEAGTAIQFGDLTFRSLSLSERHVAFDLTLTVAEGETDLGISLQYNRDLFDDQTAEQVLDQFKTLLDAVVAEPEQQIDSVNLLPPAERNKLLVEWNATEAAFDRDRLIHELFEAQVERTPEAVAVVCEDETLSYSELELRTNRLAQFLRHRGVAPGSVVGINLERSANLLVAILGILKAGAAYLPLDPSHPEERLKLILENARVELLITSEALRASVLGCAAKLLVLDSEWASIAKASIAEESGARLPRIAHPEQSAYLLYTSGSTGRPKGVAVPHRAVVNFLHSMAREPRLTADDVFVSVTTASFDIFGLELYLPLMVGARLVLPSQHTTADGAKLRRMLTAQRATAMQATPATWRLLLAAGWQGEPRFKLLCGGEALDGELAKQLVPRAASLWNLYGPTETTIWSMIYKAEAEQAGYVPIGRPIANTSVYVLDSNFQLVPTGAPGELFIGGDGLAHGYWGMPALTAEKFVPDHLGENPGARLYRTGDLVRWRRDGVLEFLGRLDNQVKVRGFRIELGEVEAALANCAGVRQAVVVAQKDASGEQQLVGYIVPAKQESALDTGALRTALLERLPESFVPSLFVSLEALPLTPNGKVDRKALPKPEVHRAPVEYLAPRSEIERLLVEIWKQTLGVEKPGLKDNFFDLGGHSLLLAQVQSRLSQAGYEVSMLDLLRNPTIETVAARLTQQQTGRPGSRIRHPKNVLARREIAIVGMAGRFPKAGNVEEFWQRLSAGDECISFFTDEELAESGIAPGDLKDPNYVKAAGVLEGAEMFDAAFFDFHPREAELMDPQHRIFLQCAWHALEDAGYDPARYPGRIGVFGGAGLNTYLFEVGPTLSSSSALRYQAFIGNDKDFLTTRVSYKLNLKGPSLDVQTACSTSLVAVHLACQSLLAGECEMALAGGVAIRAPLKQGYVYEEGGILSPDARCRAFDKNAKGTVFGNGAGIVVLKPLEKALADGDNVYAVIKGSAINNDGNVKLGYTAPSVDGQAGVISDAFAVSGVNPETVTYVEAHGTGTPLGDPIEVAALQEAFRGGETKKQFCAIGSVKTNVGHLDTAAGVTGLIKTVCALRRGQLPPSLNFTEPNPKIDFANSPFYVNTKLTEWRANGTPRRAGVSSFGIGGTNAHVILEEAPRVEPGSQSSHSGKPWQLITLSAKTDAALEKATQLLAEKLRGDADLNLGDVAYTTQVGRQVFAHRRVAVCTDTADAVSVLESLEPGRVLNGFHEGTSPAIVFLFPGQGTQYVNMARELYESEPVFASEVDKCIALLKPHLDRDLRDLLFPSDAHVEQAVRELEQTAFAQPALFVVEYALARLWMSWGVRPAAMLGHSIGEYVAAHLSGVFLLEDALALVAARGRLMQALPAGAMLAVQLGEAELRARLTDGLSVAAVNGPASCVVSGTTEMISAFADVLSEQGIAHTRLHTSHAFHSSMMEPILDEFAALVERCNPQPPSVRFISNLTGEWIGEAEATDVRYWTRHLRETVRFGDGIKTILGETDRLLLEVGPGRALTTLARSQFKQAVTVASLPHPRDKQSDVETLLNAVGRLWIAGAEIDWRAFHAHEQRRRVSLPGYPFEERKHWIKGEAKRERIDKSDPSEWFYVPAWRRSVLPSSNEERDGSDSWLLLEPDGPFATKLAEHLLAQGIELSTARFGNQFARVSERNYVVNPRSREDYNALLQDLRARERFPKTIIHAWNVTTGAGEQLWEEARCRSFDSLLFLAQAIERVDPGSDVRIAALSSNMQKVCGERELRLEKSLLLGPLKVIPQEYPNQRCQSIDLLLPPEDSPEWNDLCRDLFEELTAPLQDRVVAYRGGERWVQTFEHWRRDETPQLVPRLRDGGTYLITGGLGGIGLTLAEQIARSVKAHLILTGRSALPERVRWPEWLAAHGEQDRASQTIRKIQLLEELGSEVLALVADVADEDAMSNAVNEARARFGNIHGVVHAAGIAGGGIIHLKTPEAAEEVLKPKTRGTLVLHSALKNSELDFFLLCSSTNAIIGGFGQSDYCAANAFCDAFAQSHFSHRGPYFVSVNWDRWQEVGMAARTEENSDELSLPAFINTNGSALKHPLLGSPAVESSNRVIFISQFSPASHWVLSEHMVAGLPTVPGTTYLEMARAAFAHLSPGHAAQIREVTFSVPLVIEDGHTREVATLLERDGGDYSFRVLSRVEARWQEHARGKIGAAISPTSYSGSKKNQVAIDKIIDRGRKASTGVQRNGDADHFITTGPRWHSLREAYVADNEALAVLEIDESFADDFATYELHPSLLDIATGFIQFLGDGDYLPLVYERLTVHSPIPRKVLSHVVFRGDAVERREIITCDVSILGEDGVEAVTIDGFSMKRVAAGALQQAQPNNGYAPKGLAPEKAAMRELSDGIPPAKGAEVFRRILSAGNVPQLIVSTRDIHELIQGADALTRDRLLEESEGAGAKKLDHARPASSGVYTEPKGEVERRIASVWQRVLGIEQVGVHDNFFELGGTSLNGIQLVAELKKEFQIDIPVVSVFEATTVAELAKYLSRDAREETFDRIQDRADKKKRALAAPRRPPGRVMA